MATLTQDELAYPAAPTDEASMSLVDLLAIVRRRRWLLFWVFLLLSVVAFVVAFSLPAVYRSTATILIKEQEIPQEFVRSTVTSYADERIQVISQQVLTRATMLELVDRYNLYGSARQRETSEEILDRMRRDIKLVPVSAEVTDRRTGTAGKATIAFNLSFESQSAVNAQKIANELTTLFLNENVKNRQQKAAETTSFIDEELSRLVEHINGLEKALANFKRRNQGRTPDLAVANLAGSERADLEIQRTERDIAFLTDRKLMLENQLADTKPQAPLQGGGVLEPTDRLRALQSQLTSLSGLYSDNHPDVRRVRREIAALEAQSGPQGAADDRDMMLERLRGELTGLRKRYSDQHPDVIKLKRTYDLLEATVRASPGASARSARKPDNPAFLNLQTQIATTQSQIESLQTEREELRERLAEFQLRLATSGEVEREYLELVRDMDSSRSRFRELRDKQMQAQVAEQLERSRKAERFTIIEPPVLPERPYRPNRQLVVLMGLLLALAGAISAVSLAHAVDGGVHGPRDVLRVMQVPVLAIWPQPVRADSARRRRVALLSVPLALLLLGSAGAALFHLVYMPLDVLWFSVMRRLGL